MFGGMLVLWMIFPDSPPDACTPTGIAEPVKITVPESFTLAVSEPRSAQEFWTFQVIEGSSPGCTGLSTVKVTKGAPDVAITPTAIVLHSPNESHCGRTTPPMSAQKSKTIDQFCPGKVPLFATIALNWRVIDVPASKPVLKGALSVCIPCSSEMRSSVINAGALAQPLLVTRASMTKGDPGQSTLGFQVIAPFGA
jgi:hypothetical protein